MSMGFLQNKTSLSSVLREDDYSLRIFVESSSVGRTSDCGSECQGFDSLLSTHLADLKQNNEWDKQLY